MEDAKKNKAAAELGRLGGQKTAERGPEYYAEIQAKRQVRAGGRPKNPPKTAFEGEISICEIKNACAVLVDGTRLFSRQYKTSLQIQLWEGFLACPLHRPVI